MSSSSSQKEERILAQFKNLVADVTPSGHDDYYLTKWLKARNWDVKKAETMYRNVWELTSSICNVDGVAAACHTMSKQSLIFRKKMRSDKILEEFTPPKVLLRYLAGGVCTGHDKEGSPIGVELFGHLDMKGLMWACRKSDLEKTKIWQCEIYINDMEEMSKKLGSRVDNITVIVDMENTGSKNLWRPGIQMYTHMVGVLEDNYPEMVKKLYIINAPGIFPILWKIGRPLISDAMRNKIHILGSDYKSELLKAIDAEELPACYGGSQTDPDGNPRCATKICQGGEVPREFYLSENKDFERMECVQIDKGKKIKLEFDVLKPGSILKWEFRTDDFDIGFGVIKISGKKSTEVVPIRRYNSHQVTDDGDHVCSEPGVYAAVFDNSYSWTRGKTLYYNVELFVSDAVTIDDIDQLTCGGSWTKLTSGELITHL